MTQYGNRGIKNISLVIIYTDFMLKQHFVKWNILRLIIIVFLNAATRRVKNIYIAYIFIRQY